MDSSEEPGTKYMRCVICDSLVLLDDDIKHSSDAANPHRTIIQDIGDSPKWMPKYWDAKPNSKTISLPIITARKGYRVYGIVDNSTPSPEIVLSFSENHEEVVHYRIKHYSNDAEIAQAEFINYKRAIKRIYRYVGYDESRVFEGKCFCIIRFRGKYREAAKLRTKLMRAAGTAYILNYEPPNAAEFIKLLKRWNVNYIIAMFEAINGYFSRKYLLAAQEVGFSLLKKAYITRSLKHGKAIMAKKYKYPLDEATLFLTNSIMLGCPRITDCLISKAREQKRNYDEKFDTKLSRIISKLLNQESYLFLSKLFMALDDPCQLNQVRFNLLIRSLCCTGLPFIALYLLALRESEDSDLTEYVVNVLFQAPESKLYVRFVCCERMEDDSQLFVKQSSGTYRVSLPGSYVKRVQLREHDIMIFSLRPGYPVDACKKLCQDDLLKQINTFSAVHQDTLKYYDWEILTKGFRDHTAQQAGDSDLKTKPHSPNDVMSFLSLPSTVIECMSHRAKELNQRHQQPLEQHQHPTQPQVFPEPHPSAHSADHPLPPHVSPNHQGSANTASTRSPRITHSVPTDSAQSLSVEHDNTEMSSMSSKRNRPEIPVTQRPPKRLKTNKYFFLGSDGHTPVYKDIQEWSAQEVVEWVKTLQIGDDYSETFANLEIGGEELVALDDEGLKAGLQMDNLFHRRRVLGKVEVVKTYFELLRFLKQLKNLENIIVAEPISPLRNESFRTLISAARKFAVVGRDEIIETVQNLYGRHRNSNVFATACASLLLCLSLEDEMVVTLLAECLIKLQLNWVALRQLVKAKSYSSDLVYRCTSCDGVVIGPGRDLIAGEIFDSDNKNNVVIKCCLGVFSKVWPHAPPAGTLVVFDRLPPDPDGENAADDKRVAYHLISTPDQKTQEEYFETNVKPPDISLSIWKTALTYVNVLLAGAPKNICATPQSQVLHSTPTDDVKSPPGDDIVLSTNETSETTLHPRRGRRARAYCSECQKWNTFPSWTHLEDHLESHGHNERKRKQLAEGGFSEKPTRTTRKSSQEEDQNPSDKNDPIARDAIPTCSVKLGNPNIHESPPHSTSGAARLSDDGVTVEHNSGISGDCSAGRSESISADARGNGGTSGTADGKANGSANGSVGGSISGSTNTNLSGSASGCVGGGAANNASDSSGGFVKEERCDNGSVGDSFTLHEEGLLVIKEDSAPMEDIDSTPVEDAEMASERVALDQQYQLSSLKSVSRDQCIDIFKEACGSLSGTGLHDTEVRISLIDPISKTRIKNPVRSAVCDHLDYFDFNTFCQSSNNGVRTCPLCWKQVSIKTLILDMFLDHVLKSTPHEVTGIIISGDGSWKHDEQQSSNSFEEHSPASIMHVDLSCDE